MKFGQGTMVWLKVASFIEACALWLVRAHRGSRDARRVVSSCASDARRAIERQDWDRAVFSGKMAIAADPTYADGYRTLGYAYLHSGDMVQAREFLSRGSALAPDDAWFLAHLGEAELAQDHWQEAETAYRQALVLKPNQANWLVNLALAVEKQGRLEETAMLLEEAYGLAKTTITADTASAEAYDTLGIAATRLGNIAEARQVFSQGALVAPDNPWLLAHLGELELGVGNLAEAEAAYRRALALKSNEPKWILNLALAIKRQGRLEEAAKLLERAYALAPDYARVLVALGDVHLQQGDLQRAQLALTEAIKQAPTFADAHYRLAETFARLGRWQEALGEARKAVELEPKDVDFREFVEVILFNLGQAGQDP